MIEKDKIVNNDPSINLRLPALLKSKIKAKGLEKNQTVSKFIRELLTNYMEGTLFEKEIVNYKEQEFVNSTEFLQLIVWIYSCKNKVSFPPPDYFLEAYISTLKRIEQNLPTDLSKEFDKVLYDVLRLKNLKLPKDNFYYFCGNHGETTSFGYQVLEDYLLNYGREIKYADIL